MQFLFTGHEYLLFQNSKLEGLYISDINQFNKYWIKPLTMS